MGEPEVRYSTVTAPFGKGHVRLEGVVMRYGALAQLPDGRQERFLPGAFNDVETQDLILNVQHERVFPIARTGGGGLTLTDSGSMLSMAADLSQTTAGREAYELVRARVLRGLSVEFTAIEERMVGNIREIELALLGGMSVVDQPAYEASTVEARQRAARQRKIPTIATLRGNIPAGRILDCRCSPGDCRTAIFEPSAFESKTLQAAAERQAALAKKARERASNDSRGAREREAAAAKRARARQQAAEEAASARERAQLASLKAEEQAIEADEAARTARGNERLRKQREAERAAERERLAQEQEAQAAWKAAERKRLAKEAAQAEVAARREAKRLAKIEAQERARAEAAAARIEQAAAAEERDLIAVWGQYNAPLASRSRGSLRTWPDGNGGLNVAIDVLDTARGREVLESMGSTPIYARPYLDTAASVFAISGQTATYSGAVLSALIIGPSDASRGWTALRRAEEEGEPTPRFIVKPTPAERRRLWL